MSKKGHNNPPKITLLDWIFEVMNNPNLSEKAKHMAHVIYHHWDFETNSCSMSENEFSRLMSVTPRTIRRNSHELKSVVDKVVSNMGRSPNKFINRAILTRSECPGNNLNPDILTPLPGHSDTLTRTLCQETDLNPDIVTGLKEGKGGTIGGVGEIHRFSTGSLTKKQPQKNNIDQIKKSDREIVKKKIRWTKLKIDGLFDQFWQNVPAGRKVGKPKSRAIFEKLIKGKVANIDPVQPEKIIEGMRRFNQAVEERKTELQFIPHPTTWLNDGRWLDENEDGENKAWGWWREKGAGVYRSLGTKFWRGRVRDVKPNGHWPWEELGPPPGHPECLLPDEANKAYGEKYDEQVKALIEQYGEAQ